MHLPHLSVLCLVAAIAVRALVVTRGREERHVSSSVSSSRISVLLACRDRDPWREYVHEILERTPRPVRVCVLVTYATPEEVPDADVVDSLLQSVVHIEPGMARANEHPNRVLRRLARRFVVGTEDLVVVLQGGARLARGWTDVVDDLVDELRESAAVVSCPPAHATGAAQFPTLRTRSTGAAARELSRPFHASNDDRPLRLVPSVCWCPELTAARGEVLRRWAARTTDSLVEQARSAPHLVPTRALLVCGARIEDAMIDADEGLAGVRATAREAAGIVDGTDGREKITKYGSTFRARVAASDHRSSS